jgi:hypothetical protein
MSHHCCPYGDGGRDLVYQIAPTMVFSFGKGTFSQTRWRFSREWVSADCGVFPRRRSLDAGGNAKEESR